VVGPEGGVKTLDPDEDRQFDDSAFRFARRNPGALAAVRKKWRRGRDSNPRRDVMPSTDFESVPL
jgi:hypothetical protein